jgi:hypothetical protein
MTRDQLASAESGRTRLQYRHAYAIGAYHRVNLLWLATGEGDPNRYQNSTFPQPVEGGRYGEAASLHQISQAMKAYEAGGATVGKTGVDKHPQAEQSPLVPLTLQNVIARARALTNERGMKAKIAKDLGVSASRVTEWLADSNPVEPGGDATLRLLHWVEIHEGKTKTSDNVSSAVAGKQARKVTRETKPKSGPPRKT